jgi:hypothetical protein
MRDACQVTGKPEAGSRVQESGQSVEQEPGQPIKQKTADRALDAGGGKPESK